MNAGTTAIVIKIFKTKNEFSELTGNEKGTGQPVLSDLVFQRQSKTAVFEKAAAGLY